MVFRLTQVLLSLNIGTEASLDFPGSVLTAVETVSLISELGNKALNISLNHYQTLTFALKFLPLGNYLQ